MLIHHIATNVLLMTSNYGSAYRYGAVVMFLHDVPDIFVAVSRILVSCEGYDVPALVVGYIPMLVSWAYFRLMYLPWIIYGVAFHCRFESHLSDMDNYLNMAAFFLSCLLVLHCIWFKAFLQMGYRYLTKGEAKDAIRDVTKDANQIDETREQKKRK